MYSYAALAFVSQVYGDASQSKVFIQNAKQLASSFFDEPSFDSGIYSIICCIKIYTVLILIFIIIIFVAVAMTMIGQYWYNLTSDQVNASQYSSLGYSLAKYVFLSLTLSPSFSPYLCFYISISSFHTIPTSHHKHI